MVSVPQDMISMIVARLLIWQNVKYKKYLGVVRNMSYLYNAQIVIKK